MIGIFPLCFLVFQNMSYWVNGDKYSAIYLLAAVLAIVNIVGFVSTIHFSVKRMKETVSINLYLEKRAFGIYLKKKKTFF